MLGGGNGRQNAHAVACPDRHGSNTSRYPSLDVAQAVLHLAVTIVQWARADALSKQP